MSTAALHVTKLAAAKRQIQAAIRLFFLEEDELAIHTVASAAYGLLKDLKRDRGQSEAADIYRTAFFYVVRDFRRGTLPAHFTSDPSIMAEVERIADQLFFITADSKLPDVKLTIPQDVEKQYWNDNNRAANFLKHADRDTDGTLSLERIDNNRLLLKCCSAYQDIAPDDLGNEELAFENVKRGQARFNWQNLLSSTTCPVAPAFISQVFPCTSFSGDITATPASSLRKTTSPTANGWARLAKPQAAHCTPMSR